MEEPETGGRWACESERGGKIGEWGGGSSAVEIFYIRDLCCTVLCCAVLCCAVVLCCAIYRLEGGEYLRHGFIAFFIFLLLFFS